MKVKPIDTSSSGMRLFTLAFPYTCRCGYTDPNVMVSGLEGDLVGCDRCGTYSRLTAEMIDEIDEAYVKAWRDNEREKNLDPQSEAAILYFRRHAEFPE